MLRTLCAPLRSAAVWRVPRALPLRAMSSAAGASIPVVDVSAWTHSESSADDQRIAAQAWDEAMKEFGFAIVVGHGVGEGTVAALDAVSRAFFSLPSYEKSRHGDSGVYGPEGYTRQGVEAVERSSSIKTPGTKERDAVEAPPDPVESFVFQAPPPPNLAGAGGRPLPRKPATLLPAAHAYWQSMDILLASLHRMSAAALGIDSDFFEEPYRYPNGNALRLAWYPSRDGGDGAHAVPRYGGHTDYQVSLCGVCGCVWLCARVSLCAICHLGKAVAVVLYCQPGSTSLIIFGCSWRIGIHHSTP